MDLTPYVAALRDDLASASAVGDEATTRAGAALAAALEPAVRLAMMNALADLAAEVSDALDDHTVGLRLSGRDVRVVVDRDPAPAPAEEPEETPREGFFAGPSSSPFVGAGPFGRPGGGDPFSPGFGRGGPDVGDISRMTLRLVDQIKGQAEQAAAAQGLSLNSWVAQAVQGALRDAGRAGGWPGHGRGRGSDRDPDRDPERGSGRGEGPGRGDGPRTGDRPQTGDGSGSDHPGGPTLGDPGHGGPDGPSAPPAP